MNKQFGVSTRTKNNERFVDVSACYRRCFSDPPMLTRKIRKGIVKSNGFGAGGTISITNCARSNLVFILHPRRPETKTPIKCLVVSAAAQRTSPDFTSATEHKSYVLCFPESSYKIVCSFIYKRRDLRLRRLSFACSAESTQKRGGDGSESN